MWLALIEATAPMLATCVVDRSVWLALIEATPAMLVT